MRTLTVTAKGQITLGSDVLKHLGVRPGGTITVGKLPDGRIEMRANRLKGKDFGRFQFPEREARAVSVD